MINKVAEILSGLDFKISPTDGFLALGWENSVGSHTKRGSKLYMANDAEDFVSGFDKETIVPTNASLINVELIKVTNNSLLSL